MTMHDDDLRVPTGTAGQQQTSTTQQVAGEATQSAREVAGAAKEHAADLAHDTWGQVRGVVDQATTEMQTQADTQARRAAGSMRTMSSQLRALSEGRPQEAGQIGELVQDFGSRLQTWAERIENEGVHGVLGDVRRFAARRPGLFLVSALGAGIVAGRIARTAKATHSGGSGQSSWSQGQMGRGFAAPSTSGVMSYSTGTGGMGTPGIGSTGAVGGRGTTGSAGYAPGAQGSPLPPRRPAEVWDPGPGSTLPAPDPTLPSIPPAGADEGLA